MNKEVLGAAVLGLILMGCSTSQHVVTADAQEPITSPESILGEQYQKTRYPRFDATDTRNRIEFAELLRQVSYESTKEDVKQLLGEPDVIYIENRKSIEPKGDEVWLYGSPDKDEFAVLGTVVFRGEEVLWNYGTTEPSPELPEEKELRKVLRHMNIPGEMHVSESLHLIRVANRLIPLGKPVSIAIIKEYADLRYFYGAPLWLYWLAQCLFEVPEEPGYMRPPMIGGYGQSLQQETRVPRFPTVIIDDVPFSLIGMVLFAHPESSSNYVDELSKENMRTEPLKPPDDPFVSVKKLWNSDRWPFPFDGQKDDFMMEEIGYKQATLQQAIDLVRSVYRPSTKLRYDTDDEDVLMSYFDKCHAEFLQTGAVWNVEKQMYTLKDGSSPFSLLMSWYERFESSSQP